MRRKREGISERVMLDVEREKKVFVGWVVAVRLDEWQKRGRHFLETSKKFTSTFVHSMSVTVLCLVKVVVDL